MENRREPQALRYLFRILDVQHQGYLNVFTLNFFFRAIQEQMKIHGQEPIKFQDVNDEVFDMVKPSDPFKITLNDLIRSGKGDTVVSILIDLNDFWTYENQILNPGANSPCQNVSSCVRLVNSNNFRCRCGQNYYGVTCQGKLNGDLGLQVPCWMKEHCKRCPVELYLVKTAKSACVSQPCHNGGRCQLTSTIPGYRCLCRHGFQGQRCHLQIEDPPCTHKFCMNNSSCQFVKGADTKDLTTVNINRVQRGQFSPNPLFILLGILAATASISGITTLVVQVMCNRKKPKDCCMDIPGSYTRHSRNCRPVSGDGISLSSGQFFHVSSPDSTNGGCTPANTSREQGSCRNV
ncbi:serine/threonine-protein phosphatase 2a regulatory subunit b'' subunit gamma [Plakobranchus ocellatus]|uniref:Serine/threonine-protein phosphatase 2a regulatory subunit b'' subunit gamma n=1 Tax=Plakobranchus ocellatus TaxID=259542 RepID=A0AAV4ATK5_9GAST|nr:serine/threonine-protein phosphatase 2a regulatory subunit b'' subunit gamma [Plakobranchus ocellatus]